MIKIFRRIRQQLVTENKFSKYLLYAIGEIALVVIGILIALQLNENQDQKKLDKSRQEYYQQLLVDLDKDIANANNFIEHGQADRNAYDSYLELYKQTDLNPVDAYNSLLQLNLLSTNIKFHSSTIESLRSSGELILFPLEIRNKLLDLSIFQNEIVSAAEINNSGKAEIIQAMGIIRGASTMASRLESQPKLKSYLKINENLPEIILGLDASHKWKDHSETASIENLKIMIDDINIIMDLINSETLNNQL